MSAGSPDSPTRDVQPAAATPAHGFPQEAFEHLAELEDGHFWFRSRNRLILWALERYFPRAGRLLEVGCGTGVVLKAVRDRFPSMEIVGADLSPEALRIAGDRTEVDLVQLDARQIAFTDSFDVVCAFDVLEHIDEDETVLTQLAAATSAGGGLMVTVPQYQWLWSPADEYGRHRRRYTKQEIDGKIERAGFSIIRSTAWVSTLLPVVALSRIRDRGTGSHYDPRRELRTSRAVNRVFELALDAELAAIRLGVTLPFGSSRLVVASKT
jgi:SAM-dependent methyltransferase